MPSRTDNQGSSFTVRGTVLGYPAAATWRDGALEADEHLGMKVAAMVDGQVPVQIAGIVSGLATLDRDEPRLAHATVLAALDRGAETLEADLPPVAPLSPGAEA